MKNKYNGNKNYIDKYIFIILFRYQLLGSNNHQLSILPKIFNKLNEDHNFEIECFASSINATSELYCSIYYDIEKYFGSISGCTNRNNQRFICTKSSFERCAKKVLIKFFTL